MVAHQKKLFQLLAANLEIRGTVAGSMFTMYYVFPTDGFTASRAPVCSPQWM